MAVQYKGGTFVMERVNVGCIVDVSEVLIVSWPLTMV
jgi:hypothetical protein